MALSKDQEREIYVAYKTIFSSKLPRQQWKRVQERVQATRNQRIPQSIILKYGYRVTCECLFTLLKDKVFESRDIAKARFPEAKPSPSTPVKTTEPAKVEQGKVAESPVSHQNNKDKTEKVEQGKVAELPVSPQNNGDKYAQMQDDPPFTTQHLVLKRMQIILEHVCFDFAKTHARDILSNMQCDCPEAGELHIWMRELGKRSKHLQLCADSRGIKVSVDHLLGSVTQIQHLAVHRQPIGSNSLELLASNAVVLCTILGGRNADSLSALQTIRDSIKTQLSTLSGLKHDIDSRLGSTIGDIATLRAELDVLEQKNIREAHDKFESHRSTAWNKVERLLPDREMEPYLLTLPKESSTGGVCVTRIFRSNARLFLYQIFRFVLHIAKYLIQGISGFFHHVGVPDVALQSLRALILLLVLAFPPVLLYSLVQISSRT